MGMDTMFNLLNTQITHNFQVIHIGLVFIYISK